MTDEFRMATALIFDAPSYRTIFTEPDERAIKMRFRTLARDVHPDRVASCYGAEASAAIDRLSKLQIEALAALKAGTFGAPRPLLTLASATMRHDCLKKPTRFFDMTAGYEARSVDSAATQASIVKIAALPRDNELLAQEADALKKLADADSGHVMFYPRLLDSFVVADGRKRLRANALIRLDGFVNLEEVKDRYPAGLTPLDMAWMWRRVLWALGGAHELGVLHGAMVPSHIMIHPVLHGVVLVDWCYSVTKLDDGYPQLKAIVGARRDWYPKDVLGRGAPTEKLDVKLAAHSMLFVVGKQSMPDAMRRYFAALASGNQTGSAYELLAQFDRILERLGVPYYPRTYRPLNW